MRASRVRRLHQTLTFFRKETVEMLRQPQLLVMMVFGPLLVMVAFGLGYDDSPEPLDTVVVAPAGSLFMEHVDEYAADLGPAVHLVSTTSDPATADRMLTNGEADVSVTFPDEPLARVLSGEQAVVVVRHTRLDPIERTAIRFATDLAVARVNAQILATIVRHGQEAAGPAGPILATAQGAVDELDAAAQSGDTTRWDLAVEGLDLAMTQLDESVRTSAVVTSELGGREVGLAAAIGALRTSLDEMQQPSAQGPSPELVAQVRTGLQSVDAELASLAAVDPAVLVQPLRGTTELAVADVDDVADWYAPAAVILMLQQFGIAFGALSFVRERQLGIDDVLRVAPVGSTQAVIGKYIAYLLVGGILGAVLTVGLVTLLDVPLAGSIGEVAAVMSLVLFASIGLGMLVAFVSSRDAQAVQYTMIILLATLFFSGFFLSIGRMQGVAAAVPWLLPATYGMEMLRDVMLRGAPLDEDLVAGLAIYGGVVFLLALIGAHRRLRRVTVAV